MKKIIVAKSAGFCFGVSRSVDMAEELLKEGEAYSLGQLIHNDDVVNRLASMGMKLINSPEELPEGERVIIRSHGVSKEIYDKLAQRSARITDATCPKVKRIHMIVAKATEQGRFVLIIGMRNHPEVEAICGWCGEHALCVNLSELENLFKNDPTFSVKPITMVIQTTQTRSNFTECANFLKKMCTNVEIFDTAIAIMAGLMIIPAVFAFSGGDPDTLQAGPALMFITIPKVFASMGLGTPIGILFFVLVLCAALTSSIALTESAVSTFQDELKWCRQKSTLVVGAIMIVLGSLSSLGYGPLACVKIIGMQFLDFFDFLTNSVMMPIAAIATCLLISRVIGLKKIEDEVVLGEGTFKRKKIFNFMIKYLCPIFAAIILLSSVANAFGWISM